MNTKNSGTLLDQKFNTSQFLSHPDEPLDNYSEYVNQGNPSADGFKNTRNLFDDSNIEDRKWLNTAREFIKKIVKS